MGRQVWICSSCSAESLGYFGQCQSCGAWGTLEKHNLEKKSKKNLEPKTKHSLFVDAEEEIFSLADIEDESYSRLSSGSGEFDRVLGGGIVAGSVNLIGGQPGIGKSTILLQIAFHASNMGMKVLYISAEESSSQLKLRANRLFSQAMKKDPNLREAGGNANWDNILVYTESNLEKIIEAIKSKEPSLVIVDR